MTHILMVAAVIVIGIALAKKLFKMGITIAVVALILYGLSYFNILHI